MNREQKAAVVEQIAADISAAEAIFAIDYRGITVAQADALRGRLRDADASFRVVKNSLTERAADRAGVEALKPLLEGPTALTFVTGDAAAAAKAIADFARTTQLLAFKGGLMDGATLSSAEITSISRLPSRDVLYGQLVGLVASPVAGLARTLNALIGGLAVALGGVLGQRGGAPEVPVAAPTEAAADMEAQPAAETTQETAAENGGAGDPEASAGDEAPAQSEAPTEGEAAAEGEAATESEAPVEAAAEGEAPAGERATDELEEAGEPASEPDESKEN